MGLEGHRRKASGARPMGDGKAETEVGGYGVILWGFPEILWDFNVLLKFVSV